MITLLSKLALIMKPYHFKKYNITFSHDDETGWWSAYNNGVWIHSSGTAEDVERNASYLCMCEYKIVQFLCKVF